MRAKSIYHAYPRNKVGNGISVYGEYLDRLLSKLYVSKEKSCASHIEIGYSGNSEFWYAFGCARKNIPYILTLHDPPVVTGKPFFRFIKTDAFLGRVLRKVLDVTIGRIILRYILSRARVLIVLNRKSISTLSRYTNVIYLPQPMYFKPIKYKQHSSDIVRILFFGNISQRKGVDLLLNALTNISGNNNCELTLIGARDRDRVYQQRVDELIERSDFKINDLGYVDDAQLTQAIARTDIVVLPYRDSGIVHASAPLAQSMTFGKVIVASDIDTFSSEIIDGENGYLFRQDDALDLQKKLELLLSRKAVRDKVGVAASKTMLDQHNDELIAAKLMEIYEKYL